MHRIRSRLRGGGRVYNGPPYSTYPLSDGYGPARLYPVGSIVTGTGVTLSADGEQFTVGATTGTLTMGGNSTMPVVVGDTIAVWFKAIAGTPTTASIRFITSGGANIGASNTNLTLSNGYYAVTATVPATAAYINFFCTNTGGSDIVIGRPSISVQGATSRSTGTEGNLWTNTTAGKQSGSGTAATLNTDGTVSMPTTAVQYARCDLNLSSGKQIVFYCKLSDNNVRSALLRLSDGQLFQLEFWGNGYWGRRITVAGTTTSVYAQVDIDNNTSVYYTAAAITLLEAYAYEGTDYPGARPAGEVSGSSYSRSEIVVQQSAGQINFFIAGSNPNTAKYTRWQVKQYTGAAGSGAGWTMERIHEVTRTGDQAFKVGNDLTDAGEHLLAWREAASDFIGGDTHGYQVGLTATLTIDGSSQTIDGSTNFRCTTAVFTMTSELYRFGTSTKILSATQTLTFSGGKLSVSTDVTNVSGGALDIVRAYSMWSFARRFNNATTGTTNQIFTAYTNSAGGSGAATGSGNIPATFDSNASTWTLTGSNGITATFTAASGWGASGDSWLQSASNSNKIYFSPTGYFADAGPGYSFANGATVSITADYTLDTAN